MRLGKRLQEYRIDQTKDGCVGADPKAEDEDRRNGEARRFEEHADGLAKRLKKTTHSSGGGQAW
jgi:hypothetical protein